MAVVAVKEGIEAGPSVNIGNQQAALVEKRG
jgi:hypothetical protein